MMQQTSVVAARVINDGIDSLVGLMDTAFIMADANGQLCMY